MPSKRPNQPTRLDRIESSVELIAKQQRTLSRTSPGRMDRIEAGLEKAQITIRVMAEENRKAARVMAEENRKAAQENERFHSAVRGAIESLADSASKHEKAIARIEKQWEAYLRTMHPKQ